MTSTSVPTKLAALIAVFVQSTTGQDHCDFGNRICQYPDDDTRVPLVSHRVHMLAEELTGVPATHMRTRLSVNGSAPVLEVYDVKGVRVAGPLTFESLPVALQQAIEVEVGQLCAAHKGT
jgi:hypothetical protein